MFQSVASAEHCAVVKKQLDKVDVASVMGGHKVIYQFCLAISCLNLSAIYQ